MRSKKVVAEYRAAERTLKLEAPLEGVADHARVMIEVEQEEHEGQPWMRLAGTLAGEAGDSLSSAIETLFGKDASRG